MHKAKIFGGAVLALIAATGQGFVVFWYLALPGSFWSRSGFTCCMVVALVEAIVLALTIVRADQMHAHLVANPDSQLGQSLRGARGHLPAPPPASAAWDGEWEDPTTAAAKMRADR